MSGHSSCLVDKLSHYVDLDDEHRSHLARIEKDERPYTKGAEIHQTGDRAQELFVVRKGWLFSYTDLPDGRRQIVKIHHPGDIIGFPDIALKHVTTTLRTAEDVMTDSIRLPLTQGQIGDCLGLTNVYISRTFLRMEADGLIRRVGDHLQLLREDALIEMSDFRDRYADMDTSWFPKD